MSTIFLKFRLFVCTTLLFGLIYVLLCLVGYATGHFSPIIFAVMAFGMVFLQYMISPKIVEWSMKVKYVSETEYPKLHLMVNELAHSANIPKPKVGISQINAPNAFAFGRSKRDGRVCVTQGLLKLLNEGELKAVLAHEISHIKHRDMVVITTLSVIPLICYFIYVSFFWSGLFRGRNRNTGAALAIAMAAFFAYMISNLLVLWASRIREYYADYGAAKLTSQPHTLASALFRIVHASALLPSQDVKTTEGMKAFFLNDLSSAKKEIHDLVKADLNKDGHLDISEVEDFAKYAKPTFGDRVMESLSSHPHPINRIKRLAKIV